MYCNTTASYHRPKKSISLTGHPGSATVATPARSKCSPYWRGLPPEALALRRRSAVLEACGDKASAWPTALATPCHHRPHRTQVPLLRMSPKLHCLATRSKACHPDSAHLSKSTQLPSSARPKVMSSHHVGAASEQHKNPR